VVDCSLALGEDANPYTAAAHDLWQLVESLDTDAVDLHGISTGAKIALEFASRYPDWVRHLVLGGFEARPDRASRAMRAHWNLIAERLGMEVLADEVLLRSLSRQAFETSEVFARAQQWMRAAFRKVESAAYVRASLSGHAFDAERVCAEVQAPTLLMAGREDSIAPLVGGESGLGMRRLLDLIPRSTLMIFDDMGHAYFFERARVVADAISQFIRTGQVLDGERISIQRDWPDPS
jgi:pimeloyl-ACP methyl ester carboxylesterase